MHQQQLAPPVAALRGAFTMSFDESADGGPAHVAAMFVGYPLRVWHRWNGVVVNTMVRFTSVDHYGDVVGLRMVDDVVVGRWQCAIDDIVHIQYQ